MTYHVLVPDNVAQAALDILNQASGFRVTAPGKMARDETLSAVGDADALIIRSSTKVDAELLGAAPQLKYVARAGVGVDNIDLAEATRRGVVAMNTPGGNTISTAEHTFGLLISLARHIPAAQRTMLEERWDRKLFMGVELNGKTLGLIGFGRVGRAVARRAAAFGMRVLAYDAYQDEEMADAAAEVGAQLVDLSTIYAESDFISLHPTLTDETQGMINTASIARMKPGVRIVNTGRGALINDVDLAEAIKSGHVAGAAVDVYAQEPPPPDHPLLGLPGVVHTPHLAASTSDAQITVAVEAAQQIVDALLTGECRNVVNPEALAAARPAS